MFYMKSHYLLKPFLLGYFMLLLGSQVAEAQETPAQKMSAEEQKSFDELASMSLEELLNLKVTVASKKAEKISDAAGVISVLTREELESFGGITLRDILERVPSMVGASSAFTERYGMASR